MEKVLAVSDIDFDPALVTDISQLSAEEFLLYVRYEAEQCPGVVRAPVDSDQFKGCQTEYMPKVEDIPLCHEMFLPSPEWENEVVEAFSRFRLHLSQLSKDLTTRERKQAVPSMKDEASWFRFCLGGTLAEADGSRDKEAINTATIIESIKDDLSLRKDVLLSSLVDVEKEVDNESKMNEKDKVEDHEEGEILEEVVEEASLKIEYDSAVPPSNQLLLQFDQVLTQRLLAFFSNWLCFPSVQIWNLEGFTNTENGDNAFQSTEKMYAWIFSLLSRLEKPLYMDAAATVRDIYRQLCIQRVELTNTALSQAEADAIDNVVPSDKTLLSAPAKRTREPSNGVITSVSLLPMNVQQTLAVLNTVIVICGKYFGQEELEVAVTPNSSEADVEKNDVTSKYTTLVPDEDLYSSSANNSKNNGSCGDYDY